MSLMELRTNWIKLTGNSDFRGTKRCRVVVAATFTAEPIIPYLGMDMMDGRDAPPIISIAPYNQIFQVCQDWPSLFADHPPEVILILWRIEDFLSAEFRGFQKGESVDAALAKLDELSSAIRALRSTFKGILIVSTPLFPQFAEHHIRALGNAAREGAFHRNIVDHWVSRMREIGDVSLVDLDGIQRYVGLKQAFDARKWYLFRQPFPESFWREIAADVTALIRAQTIAAKKCVIVDCDNTLWGGIIGEDGLEGIALGDDFPGSVFADFQRQLLGLRAQGVMIALCSKNNERDVWEVFEKHDGMVLSKSDIVAYRINWLDKPSNIKELAEEINIGLDSLVFVDDNPMEIEHVRFSLPSVDCIQVPSELSAFPGVVAGYRGFDREKVSEEDRARSDMMVRERSRRELATSLDGDSFRKALGLKIDLFVVKGEHVARVVQLINKTNQFNLTTLRKTSAELNALMAERDVKVLAWRVADRFGDYGLVGVAILELTDDAVRIETLLMSCRVLGRGVERSVFAALGDIARERGARRLVGEYRASSKNQLVARLYADHGFVEAGQGIWVLDNFDGLVWPDEIERPGL